MRWCNFRRKRLDLHHKRPSRRGRPPLFFNARGTIRCTFVYTHVSMGRVIRNDPPPPHPPCTGPLPRTEDLTSVPFKNALHTKQFTRHDTTDTCTLALRLATSYSQPRTYYTPHPTLRSTASSLAPEHFMPEPDINAVIHDINKHVVEPTELTNPGFSEQVRLR